MKSKSVILIIAVSLIAALSLIFGGCTFTGIPSNPELSDVDPNFLVDGSTLTSGFTYTCFPPNNDDDGGCDVDVDVDNDNENNNTNKNTNENKNDNDNTNVNTNTNAQNQNQGQNQNQAQNQNQGQNQNQSVDNEVNNDIDVDNDVDNENSNVNNITIEIINGLEPPAPPKPPIISNGTCKTCPTCTDCYLCEFPKDIPIIAVLDTGIDKWHPELRGLVVAEKSFVEEGSGSYLEDPWDYNGHGTHVAGIIAAKNDGVGITGVAAGYPLINAKVSDITGLCRPLPVAQAIGWAVEQGATIINISCALNDTSEDLEAAVAHAIDKGVIIVAAAGNNGADETIYPACLPGVISVGAVDKNGELLVNSNYGPWVDLYALGKDVYSCLPDGKYGEKTGTSFATAYVTGLLALAQNN